MIPRTPSQRDLRRAESLFASSRTDSPLSPEPKRMRLLEFRPIGEGALMGRAKVVLPNGLEITDIGIFAKDGRLWAQLPSQQQRDGEGRPITDERGKAKYVSSVRWSTKELQDGFSNRLVEIVREQYPEALGDAP